jgi:cell division transport system permease protein
MLNRAVKMYENNLADKYSIVLVSKDDINSSDLKSKIPYISTINEIQKDKYIDKLKDDMSRADLTYLKAALPKFYSVKLIALPTDAELKIIAQNIRSYKGIYKVETFKQTFNKFHQFLSFAKSASYIFTIFIFFIALLLIIKQMEIWTLEHQNRMYVMGLFGAPYWMKSASLYKSVVIDALISALLVGIVFMLLPDFVDLAKIRGDLGLELNNFKFLPDTSRLVLFSLIISIISVTITILRQKDL